MRLVKVITPRIEAVLTDADAIAMVGAKVRQPAFSVWGQDTLEADAVYVKVHTVKDNDGKSHNVALSQELEELVRPIIREEFRGQIHALEGQLEGKRQAIQELNEHIRHLIILNRTCTEELERLEGMHVSAPFWKRVWTAIVGGRP